MIRNKKSLLTIKKGGEVMETRLGPIFIILAVLLGGCFSVSWAKWMTKLKLSFKEVLVCSGIMFVGGAFLDIFFYVVAKSFGHPVFFFKIFFAYIVVFLVFWSLTLLLWVKQS